MDSLDGYASVIMGSPSETHGQQSQPHLSCCSPQVPCVSGALVLVSDDKFLFLVNMSYQILQVGAAASCSLQRELLPSNEPNLSAHCNKCTQLYSSRA
jgi:hypothetical protein